MPSNRDYSINNSTAFRKLVLFIIGILLLSSNASLNVIADKVPININIYLTELDANITKKIDLSFPTIKQLNLMDESIYIGTPLDYINQTSDNVGYEKMGIYDISQSTYRTIGLGFAPFINNNTITFIKSFNSSGSVIEVIDPATNYSNTYQVNSIHPIIKASENYLILTNNNRDITIIDMKNKSIINRTISFSKNTIKQVEIYDNTLIYTITNNNKTNLTNWLYLYDIHTNTSNIIIKSTKSIEAPRIHHNNIVWLERNNTDMFIIKKFNRNLKNITSIGKTSFSNILLSEEYIIWINDDDYFLGLTLSYYRIKSDTIKQITLPEYYEEYKWSFNLFNSTIVWTGTEDNSYKYDSDESPSIDFFITIMCTFSVAGVIYIFNRKG